MRQARASLPDSLGLELCTCAPAARMTTSPQEREETNELTVLLSSALEARLRSAYAQLAPGGACSLLLLHLRQCLYPPVRRGRAPVQPRLEYHPAAELLEQFLQPVRRSLRADDEILLDPSGCGAALLLPLVERVGLAAIAGRVSRALQLLQSETIVPPLSLQTEIDLGLAGSPAPDGGLARLLLQAGQIHERIIFRPALHLDPSPHRARARLRTTRAEPARDEAPFLQIPSRLPEYLTQVLPYDLARELRCAPVGRDHLRLTVAMADPHDTAALARLRAATGLRIFPVSCNLRALDDLLADGW